MRFSITGQGVSRSLRLIWQKSCINGAPSNAAAAILGRHTGDDTHLHTALLLADQLQHQASHTVNACVAATDQRHIVAFTGKGQ